jgi:hypothetical protein
MAKAELREIDLHVFMKEVQELRTSLVRSEKVLSCDGNVFLIARAHGYQFSLIDLERSWR